MDNGRIAYRSSEGKHDALKQAQANSHASEEAAT